MKKLDVDDFVFDGELGCDGASIEKVADNHFKIVPGSAPRHPEWANMLNFTIKSGALGNPLRLDVFFHGGDSMAFNSYSYSWSYDAENWRPIHWLKSNSDGTEGDTLLFPPFEKDRVHVGHQVPMSYEKMVALLNKYSVHPDVRLDEIGCSLEGRPLLRLAISSSRAVTPVAERPLHYFANQHPGEHNAQWRMIGMIDWLLSGERLAENFLSENDAHFLVMMSPDSPSQGWYRVNAEGVDMNRSYRYAGSCKKEQAHEAYLAQSDLERLAAKQTLHTAWGMHTWGGIVEPLITPNERTESAYGGWEKLRNYILAYDVTGRIKPLKTREPSNYDGSWTRGPYEQLGATSILCEGGGSHHVQSDSLNAGKALMQGLAAYCAGA